MAVTWDPNNTYGSAALSNGNLTVTASGTLGETRATDAAPSDKWYIEITQTSAPASGGKAFIGYDGGNGFFCGWDQTGMPSGINIPMPSQNDVIMLAIDLGTGKAWCGLNGTWSGSGDPAAGTNEVGTGLASSGYYYFQGINSAVTVNFGASAFAYTPPSGFLGFDEAGPVTSAATLDAVETATDTARFTVDISFGDLAAIDSRDTFRSLAGRQKYISISLTEAIDAMYSTAMHRRYATSALVESGSDTLRAYSLIRSSQSSVSLDAAASAVLTIPKQISSLLSIVAGMDAGLVQSGLTPGSISLATSMTCSSELSSGCDSGLKIRAFAGYQLGCLGALQARLVAKESGADLYTGD